MKVVFLSNFYPRCKRDYYLSRSKSGLASAADAHQYAIARGLSMVTTNLTIVNLPAVFSFPHRYKDFRIKSQIIHENGLEIQNIGSCNLVFYQFLSRYKNAKKALTRIVKETKDIIIYIVVYATNPAFLRAATEIRQQYSHVRICLVLPDMPNDMISKRFSGLRLFFRLFFKSHDKYMKSFDSYVLLTKSMAEKLGCKAGTFIVNEGVYDENDSPRIISFEKNEIFTIFYSGMMYKKFGVMNLVEAVRQLKNQDVQLVLCGYGELTDEIIRIAETDNRIKYIGIISREEALKRQSQADLVVNPRIPDGNPFTKYSFPSKNLEYLASGTPTLLYQLEGIPSEYYDYCYSLDKDHTDVDSLRKMIENIMKTPSDQRRQKAISARNFILNNKNSKKAGEAILKLLYSTI